MRVALGVITTIVAAVLLGSFVCLVVVPPLTRASGIPPYQMRGGRTLGPTNAAWKVNVYADFQDPDYLQFAATALDKMVQSYLTSGDVNLTIRYFPISDGNTIGEAHWAAYAAECANEQNLFWSYHTKLVSVWKGDHAGTYARDLLLQYAREMGGLDMDQFTFCLQRDKPARAIAVDLTSGREFQLTRIPAFVVNGIVAPIGQNFSELGRYLSANPPTPTR